jgi:hypothetical protein
MLGVKYEYLKKNLGGLEGWSAGKKGWMEGWRVEMCWRDLIGWFLEG